MNINKLILQEIVNTEQQMMFVAGDLLTVQQIEKAFKMVIEKYNIKSLHDYQSIAHTNITNTLSNYLDYILLNPKVEYSDNLTFNECCVINGIYSFHKNGRKSFSPEILLNYISSMLELEGVFTNDNYIESINRIIKKFSKIKSLSNNNACFNPCIYPCFTCSVLSFNINKENVTNYIVLKKPDLSFCKKDIENFKIFVK